MKKILITGGCGMIGSHLIEHYFKQGIVPVATYHTPTIDLKSVSDKCQYVPCDIRDRSIVERLIEEQLPDTIYHLAAQSFPTISWEKPIETFDVNVNGTINVFEAIKKIRKTHPSYDPLVIVACSSAQYGSSLTINTEPVTERDEMLPLHPYGVSKVAQDLLAYQYFATFGIKTLRARIFNTTGVRKINDVISEFTRRAVKIEKKIIHSFTCGNLQTRRAITDVRDLIQALILLEKHGEYGEAYNICGTHIYTITEVIDRIGAIMKMNIEPRLDPALLRPLDEPLIYGSSKKLLDATGWKQKISLEETLKDMIDYWRSTITP